MSEKDVFERVKDDLLSRAFNSSGRVEDAYLDARQIVIAGFKEIKLAIKHASDHADAAISDMTAKDAEIARLREALRDIEGTHIACHSAETDALSMQETARIALSPQEPAK